MKATIPTLRVMMVYAIKHEHQQNMFTGRSHDVAIPQGEVHICVLIVGKDGTEPDRFMLCGKTRADIGEQTKDSDKRPAALPVCPKCEIAWKAHPDSPWNAWVKRNK